MPVNDWGEAHCKREIRKVCKYFGVRPCGYEYSNERRSVYWPVRQVIARGRKDPWKTKDILVHELAHHIHECKNPPRSEPVTDRFGRTRWTKRNIHGKEFQYYLIRVVMLMYDTCSDYPWHQEYKSIRKAWENGTLGG